MFPERLKKFRQEKKLTHEQMANILGITRQGYGNYENGKREPDQETMGKIADFFETSVDYLQGRTDDPSPSSKEKYSDSGGRAYFDGGKDWTEDEVKAADDFIKLLRQKAAERKDKQ